MRTSTTITFCGIDISLTGIYTPGLPATLTNPADPAEFEIESISIGKDTQNLYTLFECLSFGERTLISLLEERAIDKLQFDGE